MEIFGLGSHGPSGRTGDSAQNPDHEALDTFVLPGPLAGLEDYIWFSYRKNGTSGQAFPVYITLQSDFWALLKPSKWPGPVPSPSSLFFLLP